LEKIGSNISTASPERVEGFKRSNVEIIDPVAIHESAEISNSTIGPYASIGADCRIENSQIAESILEAGCEIKDAALSRSLIGRQAKVHARGDGNVLALNIGDNSSVML